MCISLPRLRRPKGDVAPDTIHMSGACFASSLKPGDPAYWNARMTIPDLAFSPVFPCAPRTALYRSWVPTGPTNTQATLTSLIPTVSGPRYNPGFIGKATQNPQSTIINVSPIHGSKMRSKTAALDSSTEVTSTLPGLRLNKEEATLSRPGHSTTISLTDHST